jgi:DNA mismatch endonuclease (patch repair protein)
MTDVFTKEKRSEVMSRIRGKGNKDTELAMILLLKKYGIKGWRRNQKIFGKPDFTFWKERVVLFVDGCFWHCCPIHSTKPKNNSEFWKMKLNATQKRDLLVTRTLESKNWKVVRIWEHELKESDLVAEKIKKAMCKIE